MATVLEFAEKMRKLRKFTRDQLKLASWTMVIGALFLLACLANADEATISDDIEVALQPWLEKLSASIPERFREEITDPEIEVSLEAFEWMYDNLYNFSPELSERISEEMKKYPHLHGKPDTGAIFGETFRRHLVGEDLDVTGQLEDMDLYWAEAETPEQKRAPEGGGEIIWFTGLEAKNRRHGIIHVGLDLATRRFVCYERGIGVYYAEGNLLERIRSEVLLDGGHRPGLSFGGRRIGEWRDTEEDPAPADE